MSNGKLLQSRFAHALRNQKSQAEYSPTSALTCPFYSTTSGHHGRIFPGFEQLYDHVKADHTSEPELQDLAYRDSRAKVKEMLNLRSDQTCNATAGDHSTPAIGGLTLDSAKGSRQASSPSGKKRLAEHEFASRKGKALTHVEVADPDYSRQIPYSMGSDRTKPKSQDPRLFDHKQTTRGTSSPYQTTPEPSSEWPAEATKSSQFQSSEPQSPARQPRRTNLKPQYPQRQQPGLIELQRYDPRYPGLLLQPDSRPISQEQIASEVKSIYAGLTMVETKCIQVDRTQAAAASKNIDTKLASDRWQALIALHLTLLHEHHDFFLASQHQSASPAVRRLAGKLSMPARMWKHGIGSFLELLKRRLPDSIDYMLAFIYLAYQMIALFYETVPDFEDTWIECLGDLGRYRMAIEDEDVRDRKIWAGVARSWFTKATDKNPTVGRFYHHLATLEHPNALQQVYYYSRSLTCVRPFPDARESISILFDRVLGRVAATYTHALPIDTNFIRAHAVLFENQDPQKFHESKTEFMDSLDNHIGRVTAKWKAQGVYIAVTNFASWFGYGTENVDTAPSTLHEAILHFLEKDFSERNPVITILADLRDPKRSDISKKELSEIYRDYLSRRDKFDLFRHARLITYETSAIVLRRIGDPNVLPYVHVTLAFLIAFASDEFLADRIKDAPWAELVTFLNRLVEERTKQIQAQTIDALLATDVFPAQGERGDELPLPEDYLVRGLTWSQHYFPKEWFKREHDEEERYFELERTVENRMDRVLRLGVQLSNHKRWITYDEDTHTFSVLIPLQ